MVKDVITDAWRLTKQHWKIIAINGLPLFLITLIQQYQTDQASLAGESMTPLLGLILLLSIIISTSFWVYVTRLGLYGPPPDRIWALQFKGMEVKYVGLSLLIGVLFFFGAMIIFIPAGFVGAAMSQTVGIGTGIVLGLIAVLVGGYALIRICLAWVALVDDQKGPLQFSWHMTKGSFWKITQVFFWPTLVVGLIAMAFLIPAGILSVVSAVASWVFLVPFAAISVLASGYFAFLTTELYRRFLADQPQALEDTPQTPVP